MAYDEGVEAIGWIALAESPNAFLQILANIRSFSSGLEFLLLGVVVMVGYLLEQPGFLF